MNEELKENEPLPSIRNLASDLKISIMTIKKAYDELENDGYIMSVQGKGTFIAPKNKELIKENACKEMEDYLLKASLIAKNFDISLDEMDELLKIIYRSDEN